MLVSFVFFARILDQAPAAASSSNAAAAESKDALSNVVLYHYNGIENIASSQRQPSRCSRVFVTLLGPGVMEYASSEEGLREVLHTRWPGALIDYDGPTPSIT